MALHNIVDWRSQQTIHDYYGHPLVSDRSILGTRIVQNFEWDDTVGPTGIKFAGEWYYLRHRNNTIDGPEEYYAQGRAPLTIKDHLMDLMCEMRHFHCKDPRDRLFALLSLFDVSNGRLPELLRPNYQASNTVAKVYSNITHYLVAQGNFDVLAAAQGLPLTKPDLPSWAVDWENPPDRSKLLTAKTLKPKGLKIGLPPDAGHALRWPSPSPPVGARDQGDGCLVLRGIPLGELTYVSAFPYMPSLVRNSAAFKANDELFKRTYSCWIWWEKYAHSLSELGLSAAKLPSPQSLTESECWDDKTIKESEPLRLLPDFAENGVKHHCEGRTFAVVGDVGISSLADRDGKPLEPVPISGSDNIHRLPKQLSDDDWEAGWSPTRAKCLVPPASQIGDLVCGVLGSAVAIILRPEGSQYRFVGMTTYWRSTISDAAPDLDWSEDLVAKEVCAPLRDFCIR